VISRRMAFDVLTLRPWSCCMMGGFCSVRVSGRWRVLDDAACQAGKPWKPPALSGGLSSPDM
jgi:hypothetical protein